VHIAWDFEKRKNHGHRSDEHGPMGAVIFCLGYGGWRRRAQRSGAIMSPQMNGEPREATTTAEREAAAQRPAAPPGEGHLPLPELARTDGVTRTTLAREDAKLAPLFTQDAATDFRSRWDTVQRGFVDDPKAAVRAADELVAHVTQSLAETFTSQRTELERGLDQADVPSTENLRLALRRYRSFFERLLSI
jgi:hypothetical protein